MALFPCPDCGNSVSTNASSCPKCGLDLANVSPPPSAAEVAHDGEPSNSSPKSSAGRTSSPNHGRASQTRKPRPSPVPGVFAAVVVVAVLIGSFFWFMSSGVNVRLLEARYGATATTARLQIENNTNQDRAIQVTCTFFWAGGNVGTSSAQHTVRLRAGTSTRTSVTTTRTGNELDEVKCRTYSQTI